jgi:hypothetical protein
MTRGGVVGFPQRTSTEDTNGESEYVAASDWRMGIRDSEKPFMRTVILLCWRFCVGPHWFEFDDVGVKVDNRMVRIMVVVDGEVIAVVMLKRFLDFDNGRLLVFVVMVFHSDSHMEMNGFGVVARWN